MGTVSGYQFPVVMYPPARRFTALKALVIIRSKPFLLGSRRSIALTYYQSQDDMGEAKGHAVGVVYY